GLGVGGSARRDRSGREQIAAAVDDPRAQPERAIAPLVAEQLRLELRPQMLGIRLDEAALAHHRRELLDRQRLVVAELERHGTGGIAERRADPGERVVVAVDRRLGGPRLDRQRHLLRRWRLAVALIATRLAIALALFAAGALALAAVFPPLLALLA